jgi:hypothetical protein
LEERRVPPGSAKEQAQRPKKARVQPWYIDVIFNRLFSPQDKPHDRATI